MLAFYLRTILSERTCLKVSKTKKKIFSTIKESDVFSLYSFTHLDIRQLISALKSTRSRPPHHVQWCTYKYRSANEAMKIILELRIKATDAAAALLRDFGLQLYSSSDEQCK